jgi:hypothetical protein
LGRITRPAGHPQVTGAGTIWYDIESIATRPLRRNGGTHVAAARHLHGLKRMEDIRFAILEANGKISVIPYASPNTVAKAQAS